MKRCVSFILIISALVSLSLAGVPVEDMSISSIGFEYYGLWRGETITTSTVPAHENVQLMNIRYAPIPYLMLFAGVGASKYMVDTSNRVQFKGMFSVAPSFGLSLYSPKLFNFLTVTTGGSGYYLYNNNKEKSYLYKGAFVNPSGGLIFSAGNQLDIECGGRAHVIFGEMQKTGTSSALYFSNNQNIRGYLSLTIHSPNSGGYVSLDFDASPDVSADWSRGPAESSISISAGVILKAENLMGNNSKPSDTVFPGFKKLKEKEDSMKKEMQ